MSGTTSAAASAAHIEFLLHLADNALVLGQRNAEWCGHGPVLEEDIAMANISVDLIGQARMLYQHIAELKADGSTEDTLAYFRDAPDYRNYTLLELPHSVSGSDAADGARDYAVTIVRNFFYSALMVLRWDALKASTDAQLAAIAERSVKETRYHLRHSRDWLVRLGDGTPESHAKTQAAWDHLLPYTLEFFTAFAVEDEDELQQQQVIGVAAANLRDEWQALVNHAAADATLTLTARGPGNNSLRIAGGAGHPTLTTGTLPQGKHGLHSAHLAPLLAEMQSLARQHPGATW
jgi:ring-1,2-phenylacetyl-CoA epoxidase subunit PaaC